MPCTTPQHSEQFLSRRLKIFQTKLVLKYFNILHHSLTNGKLPLLKVGELGNSRVWKLHKSSQLQEKKTKKFLMKTLNDEQKRLFMIFFRIKSGGGYT